MMKLTRLFAVVFLVSFTAAVQLHAGTVEYPKTDPVFTLEVPDGWKSNFTDDGSLTLEKTGAELLCSIMPAKDIKDEASAKASVPTFTEFVKMFGMEDVKAAGPVTDVPLPNVAKAYGLPTDQIGSLLPSMGPVIQKGVRADAASREAASRDCSARTRSSSRCNCSSSRSIASMRCPASSTVRTPSCWTSSHAPGFNVRLFDRRRRA